MGVHSSKCDPGDGEAAEPSRHRLPAGAALR